jgi:hypothetical protein
MKTPVLSLALVLLSAGVVTGCDAVDSTEGVSQDGGAVAGPQLEDTPCQDDTDCSGLLEPGGCYVAVCDASVKACAAIPMPNGTQCSDSSGCGVVEGVCDGGICQSEATADCDDADPCTDDICTSEFGCVYKALEEGAACDDGEACSLDDSCTAAGTCLGTLDQESAECEGASLCGDGACQDNETCSSCGTDCGECAGEGTCGDGKCEELESVTCPQDCETQPEPSCGDGECSGDESPESCPEDCSDEEPPQVEDLIACLTSECGGEFFACLSDPVCAESLECMGSCGSDTACLQGCVDFSGGFSPAQIGLVSCAAGSGCVDLGGGGGGGAGSGPECGDGQCEDGESQESCPEDCGGDQFGCGDGVCEAWEQWTCPEDCEEPQGPECGNGECEEGETEDSCPADCGGGGGGGGGQAGCGDGECEIWEQWTCPEDCEDAPGGPECGNGECEEGEGAETCPEDCKAEGVECGNGKCEKGESEENCAADCADSTPSPEETTECLMDQCELGACLDYPVCTASFECMAACSDSACAEECITDLSGPAKNVLDGVLECGSDEACWSGGETPAPEAGLKECLEENCESEFDQCVEDADCIGAFPCLQECVDGGGVECTYTCMPDDENEALLTLGQCGGQAGCGNTPND